MFNENSKGQNEFFFNSKTLLIVYIVKSQIISKFQIISNVKMANNLAKHPA